MRVRILLLCLLLFAAVDADILLWDRQLSIDTPVPYGPEPTIVVHERPEVAVEDEPPSFASGIRRALAEARFGDLETLATSLRAPDRRFTGGIAQLTRFYEIVTDFQTLPTDDPCQRSIDQLSFAERRHTLEVWHGATPGQPTAAVALARFWASAAATDRGCHYAADTSDARWAAMRADYARTQEYLDSIDLDQDPVAYIEAIDMGMRQGWERSTLDTLYDRAIAAFPGYYPLYAQRATTLQEKWQGRPGEQARYLRGLQSPEGGIDARIGYAFAAYRLLDEFARPNSTNADGLTFPGIVAAYQAREQRFGLRTRDWKALFYFAMHAGMAQLCHQAVGHMDAAWDSGIWRQKEYFDKDIAWYKANTPYKSDLALLGG
jgi:hypothetical protein